jgi:hypothetical protein
MSKFSLSPQHIGHRLLPAALGIGACLAVSIAAGFGGTANAGDNPPPGLLAKIQIGTSYATTNRTPTGSIRAPRKPFLNRAASRGFR